MKLNKTHRHLVSAQFYRCLCLPFILSLLLISSCYNKPNAQPIGNNISFPGHLVALSSTEFLLLNTVANGDYSNGSIQYYKVATDGNYSLLNAVSIPVHGSELAVLKAGGKTLVALSFDSSYSSTQIQFYDFTDPLNVTLLPNLTLNSFNNAGGKQAVKRLGFFARPNASPADPNYYLYGTILSYQQDDGTNGNIPPRTFVIKIDSSFTSSQMLFTLSYGLGDPNSLAYQSSAWNSADPTPMQYALGFNAPTYDGTHDLFIALPTGTLGGYSASINLYPSLPDPLAYFSGQPHGNVTLCNTVPCLVQPDYRAVSLAAVDMSAIIAGEPLNNSTYFVPLGFNGNGIPYAARTNGNDIVYNNGATNSESSSFAFESAYWTSYWANTTNLGSNASSCYPTGVTTTNTNQYTLAGDNGLFVVKNGENNGNGNGSEVFQITGLDLLSTNIATLKTKRGSINQAGESDFSKISKVQIIDPYNEYVDDIKANWLSGSASTPTKNAGPLTPYMYSRTSDSAFNSIMTAIGNISILNFGSNQCVPYWARDSFGSIDRAMGQDSAWVTGNIVKIAPGSNSTYPDATIDPNQPTLFSFDSGSGAETCTDVSPAGSPIIYCTNFLTGSISRFNNTPTSILNSF